MTHKGRAENLEGQGRSKQLDRVREGGTEGLKGASGDRAEKLARVNRGGGSAKLGGSIGDEGDLGLADEGDF